MNGVTKNTGRIELLNSAGQRKYLTLQEREIFRKEAAKQPGEIRTFCLMLYLSGCRISEALVVFRSRIDFDGQCVIIESLKQRKKGVFRHIPLPTKFLNDLEQVHRIRKLRRGEIRKDWKLWDWSRRTATRRLEEVMTSAGINGIQATANGIRHAYAIACFEKQIPINMVSKWLGHAKLETTAVYATVNNKEERDIAERLWK